MNNKKGGFGAKLLLVLILMIASAVGGAYGYRILDGKLAVRETMKAIENVDISDYDTAEQSVIQGYIDDATKNLETAKTRKEVYEVFSEFIGDVSKVQTSNEKKLEEALRAAEEAKQQYSNSQSTNNQADTATDTTQDTQDSGYQDNLTTPSDGDDDKDNGLLGSLLGGMSNGSGSN